MNDIFEPKYQTTIEELKKCIPGTKREQSFKASMLAWVKYSSWTTKQYQMIVEWITNHPSPEQQAEHIRLQVIERDRRKQIMILAQAKKDAAATKTRIGNYINNKLGSKERKELIKHLGLAGNTSNVEMYTKLGINPELATAGSSAYLIWEDLKIRQLIPD